MTRAHEEDTICAIATPLGEGGVGMIRVSGKRAIDIVQSLFSGKKLSDVPTHTVHFGKIKDPITTHVMDEVLVTVFRSPQSYTGEDVIEISCHGGLATTRSILKLMATSGARLSEPGEFTKRAFLNGRLDLTQAEAVLDVIRAKTDLSLQAALLHLQGRLSYRIGKMKERLVRIAAHLEAYIDFPEQDIEISSRNEMHQELTDILNEIQTLLSSFKTGAILRQGILVAIVGKPNVGKSSLFNTLLDRDRAIVSDVAGTTRDTLEEMIDLKGLPVRLVDTAGVTETKDRVEKMGIERTHQSIQEADFCIFVCDGSQGLTKEDQQLAQLMKSEKTLCVINKNDLAQKIDRAQLADWTRVKKQISVSTQTRNGFDELENALFELIGVGGQERADVGISKERHRQALLKTEAALQALIGDLKANQSFEFLSLNVREALDGLGELVGEIYTEDILDVIFQEFCIGK